MRPWHHWVMALVVGYIIAYYFRGLGDMTIGKLIPAGGGAKLSLVA